MSNNVRDSLLRVSASLLGKHTSSSHDLFQGILLPPSVWSSLVSIISLGSLGVCSCPSLTARFQRDLAQVSAGFIWLSQIKCSYGVLCLDHVNQHTETQIHREEMLFRCIIPSYRDSLPLVYVIILDIFSYAHPSSLFLVTLTIVFLKKKKAKKFLLLGHC